MRLVELLFILLVVAVVVAPMVLIAVSTIRYKRMTGGVSGWAVLVGGLLLALLSLDSLFPLGFAMVLRMNAEEIAEAAIFMAYAKPVAGYCAFWLFGAGTWVQSNRIRKMLASQEHEESAPSFESVSR